MSNPSKDPYTNSASTRFTLRIKTEVFNEIKNIAEEQKRSTAKQIEFILEEYLKNLKEK